MDECWMKERGRMKVYTTRFLLYTVLENANYCDRKQISDGLAMARSQRAGLQRSKRKLSGVMALFVILTAVTVSRGYTYIKSYPSVHLKCM